MTMFFRDGRPRWGVVLIGAGIVAYYVVKAYRKKP